MPDYEPLTYPGGEPSQVLRHGRTVLRPAGPWAPAVHALLRHLEETGFDGAPRVIGDGLDDQGREVLSYIEGTFVHPHAWRDEGVWNVGRLLRELHDATAGFRPPPGAVWHAWPARSDAPDAIVSHCDVGPWNIVARDGLPVAFIDWTEAGPTERLDEVAAAGWWNAQLMDDDVAARQGLPSAAARAAQLRYLVDGYRLPVAEREGLVTRMIEYAIRECAAYAVDADVTPGSADPAPLWAMAWRARSAAWMMRHRRLLEDAISAPRRS